MTTANGGTGEAGMAVEEVQGLYGAFSFPEMLLQQIWQRGDFETESARTLDGRRLKIMHPGRWNRLGGPDFRDARVCIGETVMTGDVELHLHEADWAAHGHAADPAYARVVLHIVLFPCAKAETVGYAGVMLPIFVMLPWLRCGLEEYAAENAVERLAQHPLAHAQEALVRLALPELKSELARLADVRWAQKVRYARERIARSGWREACHLAAMEVLGYARNRAPMMAIGSAYGLERWSVADEGEAMAMVAEAYDAQMQAGRWQLTGSRPANHPRIRLAQYARWCRQRPDWPMLWKELGDGDLPRVDQRCLAGEGIGTQRKHIGLSRLRERWRDAVCGAEVGGARFHTLMGDALLPLVAAVDSANEVGAKAIWMVWFCGDVPDHWVRLLRALQVTGTRASPEANVWTQGLLAWMVIEERKLCAEAGFAGRGT